MQLLAEEVIRAAAVPRLVSCHRVQFLPIVLTDLIVAGEFLRAGPGLSVLIRWRQQQGCAPGQQDVPDAVGVVVVVAGHHGGIDGNAHGRHGDAGQEVEGPALPRGGVALAPVPAAVSLEKTATQASVQPQLPGPGNSGYWAPAQVWAAERQGWAASRGLKGTRPLVLRPRPQGHSHAGPLWVPWQPPADTGIHWLEQDRERGQSKGPGSLLRASGQQCQPARLLTHMEAMITKAKRQGPSMFQMPLRSSCKDMAMTSVPRRNSTWARHRDDCRDTSEGEGPAGASVPQGPAAPLPAPSELLPPSDQLCQPAGTRPSFSFCIASTGECGQAGTSGGLEGGQTGQPHMAALHPHTH